MPELGEIAGGDPDELKRPLTAGENIPGFALTNEAEELAVKSLEGAALPQTTTVNDRTVSRPTLSTYAREPLLFKSMSCLRASTNRPHRDKVASTARTHRL